MSHASTTPDWLFVGSGNRVKLAAVEFATSAHWPELKPIGFDVKSGVSEQPLTDEETKTGAENRARAALAAGLAAHPEAQQQVTLGIGLEGGVLEWQGDMWSTVWVAVVDQEGALFSANGARCRIEPVMADLIRAGGEMGPVTDQLVGESDVRTKQGMIGVVTNNFVDRTTEYGAIAKLAIGLWYGRGWVEKIEK